MDIPFIWLGRLIEDIDRKIDLLWENNPLMSSEQLSEATDAMKNKLAKEISEAWESAFGSDGGDF